MSGHVLMNTLSELGKTKENAKLVQHFNINFSQPVYFFKNSGAQMLDSIYHISLGLLKRYRAA